MHASMADIGMPHAADKLRGSRCRYRRVPVVWRRPAPTKVRCRSIASTTTAALVAVYCPCAFARSCHTGGNTKLAVKETPYAASRTPQIVWLRCGTTVPAGQRRVDCSRVAPSQRCDVRASAGLQ